jgi:hypothetical protein
MIKKYLSILKNVVFVIMTAYALYSFITRNTVQSERSRITEVLKYDRFDKWIKYDSIRTLRADSLERLQTKHILDTLQLVMESEGSVIKKVNNLNIGFTKHLKQSEKIDELINFYELK